MTTVYVSLRDQSIAEFDPGAGLPPVFARQSTAIDDTTQLPTMQAQALASRVGLVVSATPTWPVSGGGLLPSLLMGTMIMDPDDGSLVLIGWGG